MGAKMEIGTSGALPQPVCVKSETGMGRFFSKWHGGAQAFLGVRGVAGTLRETDDVVKQRSKSRSRSREHV